MGIQTQPDTTTHPPGQRMKTRSDFFAAYPATVDLSDGDCENYLTRAIRNNDIEAVRTHLAAGANPLFPEFADGTRTALSCAAIRGKREMVQLLLSCIPPLAHTSSTTNFKGENEEELLRVALVDAATYGHVLIVRDFLDTRELDHTVIGSVLGAATRRWEVDVVELLLDRFTFNQSSLVSSLKWAVKEKWGIEYENRYEEEYFDSDPDKQARLVSRLLDETKLDLRDPLVGSPLLYEAIFRSEQRGALRVLLEQGVDPNTQWEKGETALHLLASPHRPPSWTNQGQGEGWVNEAGIALLLKHGASITVEDHNNEKTFQKAAEFSNAGIFLRYYLPDDSGLRVTNEYGETLLHRAAAGGKHSTVQYLLSKGLDVNAASRHGWTPLLCALAGPTEGHWKTEDMAIQTARLLLNANADPLAKTDDGWTVLHLVGNFPNPRPSKNTQDGNPKNLEELYPDMDEEGRELAYEMDYWDPYDRTTAGTDLVRELLTKSPEMQDLIQNRARVSYWMEDNYDFSTKERKQVYQPFRGWGGRLEEGIQRAKEPTVVEGLTALHWAAEHRAAGVAAVLIEVGGADVKARDSEEARPLDAMYRALMGSSDDPLETRDAIVKILGS